MNTYDYELYYVCKTDFPSPLYLIPFVICTVGIYLLCNLRSPYIIKKWTVIFFGTVFTVAGLIVSFASITGYIAMYKNVFSEYKQGNYLVAEGEVKNLKVISFDGKGADEFDVGSAHFVIGGTISPGYNKIAAHGGIFKSENVRVRICYVNYQDMNFIMKIEAVPADFAKNPIVLPKNDID